MMITDHFSRQFPKWHELSRDLVGPITKWRLIYETFFKSMLTREERVFVAIPAGNLLRRQVLGSL